MFGVSEAFKQPVGGAQNRKSHLLPVDKRGEPFVMALAGFAEEHRLNAAPRTQRLFDEPNTLNAHESIFRGQSSSQSHAKLLQPPIVAAAEDRGPAHCACAPCGF